MDYMKKLLGFAGRIKDKGLRQKVVSMLEKPSLSNKEFRYEGLPLNEAPASLAWHHNGEGGLAKHTYVVTRLCLHIADLYEENYGEKIDRDTLIAGALLHDIAKVFDMVKDGESFDATPLSVDHVVMGSAELYARGFPESVVHMVAAHFGEKGTTMPHSTEAVILHHADNLDAVLGTSKTQRLLQLLGE